MSCKSRFGVDNYNGMVFDKETNLIWQRHISEDRLTLAEAKLYAARLRLGGFSDWRVPTRPELESIVDLARHHPSIDTEVFPDTPNDWFWSVSPYAYDSSYAWVVDFLDGSSSYNDVSDNYRVRCVR